MNGKADASSVAQKLGPVVISTASALVYNNSFTLAVKPDPVLGFLQRTEYKSNPSVSYTPYIESWVVHFPTVKTFAGITLAGNTGQGVFGDVIYSSSANTISGKKSFPSDTNSKHNIILISV